MILPLTKTGAPKHPCASDSLATAELRSRCKYSGTPTIAWVLPRKGIECKSPSPRNGNASPAQCKPSFGGTAASDPHFSLVGSGNSQPSRTTSTGGDCCRPSQRIALHGTQVRKVSG